MLNMQKNKLYTVVILVSTLVIIVTGLRFDRMDTLFSTVAYYLLEGTERALSPVKNWYYHRQTIPLLKAKLIEQEKSRTQLLAEVCKLHGILQEYKHTETLRHFCKRYNPEQYIVCRVVKQVTTHEEQSLIIDTGSREGIEPGMIVIAHNCLIGRVQTAFPWYAKVMLITDKRSKVPIACSQTGTIGIYSGKNRSDEGELLFVSHLDTIVEGDMLITHERGSYPAGFCLGTIARASRNAQDLHYAITVHFLQDITELAHVAVLQQSPVEAL